MTEIQVPSDDYVPFEDQPPHLSLVEAMTSTVYEVNMSAGRDHDQPHVIKLHIDASDNRRFMFYTLGEIQLRKVQLFDVSPSIDGIAMTVAEARSLRDQLNDLLKDLK